MDIKRNLTAIILIGLVIVLTPTYLRWVSPATEPSADTVEQQVSRSSLDSAPATVTETPVAEVREEKKTSLPIPDRLEMEKEIVITVDTDLYIAKISNRAGGSLVEYTLKNYTGGYNEYGEYDPISLVSLVQNNDNNCTPCLSLYDQDEKLSLPFLQYFTSDYRDEETLYLSGEDEKQVHYSLMLEDGRSIDKTITFKGNSYSARHDYDLSGFDQTYRQDFEVMWGNGIKPAEKNEKDDLQYSGALMYQAGEKDDIMLKDVDPISRKNFDGNTDWVAVKNKYFMVSLMTDLPGKYASLSAVNTQFGIREITPVYSASIGFDIHSQRISTSLFFGPQDYKVLKQQGHALDDAMNWGFVVIKPISKYVILGLLTFLHNPFGDFYINYGLVLIIFALIIRVVTGPLTKKSAESTQKMQAIQPKMKAMQEKYKNDPQKKNSETMALYRKHGVNPVGGCLPMLIQMPLLFALFTVFRNTIEFRGAEFIFWISDLSQPDVIFNLPFSIPVYGDGVAVLPIVMGVTMFLQQRQSMATMDKSQRPMMYMMSAFFFLLFNTFPSGLNLYYAIYNFLSFLQQRSIKAKLAKTPLK
ncbi:MAG: membrane protein insertase YidC [Candidatus Marinimicrobia bacterium]|jgi:YidC/Oxa1 family membrane protein insertase|nr:membrane protein insertase YidC [Candidatus Neomarinimicrobiota bacterium]MBT3683644.1 membrane protein insertase YidC [Candidatus Neomarinimicrobiota bacterium]MBT3760423.1 membrane protein insertase YidC [Candidatus Neomarinimicrobiota bacterium]MBT3896499.1 membrane protein insertase YidC [Candidatus Neomarinimicrobiota bacterium]MBT4173587.1 membrane protein insertase YidC [Candidatus Neomarinimicrobiota bacterium]